MADRQVGISVKTTVNDSQLRGLKDSFRGVTREMGSDMDELSARTQKYLENLRRGPPGPRNTSKTCAAPRKSGLPLPIASNCASSSKNLSSPLTPDCGR